MAPQTTKQRKPAIKLARSDHARLWLLAESRSGRDPTVADELFAEMKNSSVQLTERFYGYYLPLFSHDREKFHNVRTEARSRSRAPPPATVRAPACVS